MPTNSSAGTGGRLGIAAAIILVVLAVLFFIGLRSRHRAAGQLEAQTQQTANAPQAVDVVQIHRAPAAQVLTLPGNARAFYETTIYARTSGYLQSWKHDIGDHVKSGELLATIETPELDDELAAAQAKVAEQHSEVDLAQASVKFAKLSDLRWESAVPEGVVSTQDRDQKRAELDTSNAKLESAEAQLKLAQAEVQGLQTLVGFKEVRAPFDGTITRRAVDIGDLVTAGSTSSTTPLFSIANSNQIRVFVDVPQSASSEIKVGMPVKISVASFQNRQFDGKVSRTAGAIDLQSRTLRVEVLVPNPDYTLEPGMYVEATFLTSRAKPPLEMPASALVFRPSGPQAAVVNADGVVEFKDVKIGRDLGDHIEVASGLSDGEQVALNISSDITSGSKVTPHLVTDTGGEPTPNAPAIRPQQTTETPSPQGAVPQGLAGGVTARDAFAAEAPPRAVPESAQ